MEKQSPEFVQSYIAELVSKAKVAQKTFERTCTDQHSVDVAVRAVGKSVFDAAQVLAEEAFRETGMGDIASKIAKTQGIPLKLWEYTKGRPSVGVIDDFSEPGIKIVAKPKGVVGAVMPSTNPIATAVGNSMMAVKARNAIIIASHPASLQGSLHTTQIMRAALKEIGAPEDLVQCIEYPSLDMTNELLRQCDVNIATGGAGMVKSVYSAGRPAFGVGQGNCQVIVDEDYPSFQMLGMVVVANRAMDQGVPCTGDQMVIVPAAREQEMKDALTAGGAYIIEDPEVVDRIRKTVFPTPAINRAVVGKPAAQLAKIFGIEIPEGTKALCMKVDGVGAEDPLCKEILCPILRYTTYTGGFEKAVEIAVANLENEGAGHSSAIWSKHPEHIEYAANLMPVGRFHVEQPSVGYNNAVKPPITIGCGSWGNNSISENLQFYHLMNITRVTTSLPTPMAVSPADWDDFSVRPEWGDRVCY